MKCCPNCFTDQYAANAVKRLAVECGGSAGICDFCGSDNTDHLLELEPESELADMIAGLVDVFSICEESTAKDDYLETAPFEEMLQKTWGLFNFDSSEDSALKIRKFLDCLFPDDKSISNLYGQRVRISDSYNDRSRNQVCALGGMSWDAFAEELRQRKRYTLRFADSNNDALSEIASALWREVSVGDVFYRARIWNVDAPPKEGDLREPPLSNDGRMNARGIKCLYLSKDETTAVSEVRAGSYDRVALIGWRASRNLKVIDLTELERVSPFMDIDVYTLLVNLGFLRRFASEMARPQCQNDDTGNYLPTQYWCEALRYASDSDGPYDGFIYKSVMHAGGENMIIYGGVDNTFEADSPPFIRRVESIDYKLEPIDQKEISI